MKQSTQEELRALFFSGHRKSAIGLDVLPGAGFLNTTIRCSSGTRTRIAISNYTPGAATRPPQSTATLSLTSSSRTDAFAHPRTIGVRIHSTFVPSAGVSPPKKSSHTGRTALSAITADQSENVLTDPTCICATSLRLGKRLTEAKPKPFA